MLLQHLGAEVTGFALPTPTSPAMFDMIAGTNCCNHILGDIRDAEILTNAVAQHEPDIVLHLAAQPLVRASYADPVPNFATNVMGTVHILDACRQVPSVKAIVIITTDKCYHNDNRTTGYTEDDKLGGFDPYSNSKACAELVTASYRDSFFAARKVGVASARAGNVIGGGDYAEDRLVPDAIRAFIEGNTVAVRNPSAVRPWQHVLEPLYGYLLLAQSLYVDQSFAAGWNFGPAASDMAKVEVVVSKLAHQWGAAKGMAVQLGSHPHEAAMLTLDSSHAAKKLFWTPKLNLDQTLEMTVDWYRAALNRSDLADITRQQIISYLAGVSHA